MHFKHWLQKKIASHTDFGKWIASLPEPAKTQAQTPAQVIASVPRIDMIVDLATVASIDKVDVELLCSAAPMESVLGTAASTLYWLGVHRFQDLARHGLERGMAIHLLHMALARAAQEVDSPTAPHHRTPKASGWIYANNALRGLTKTYAMLHPDHVISVADELAHVAEAMADLKVARAYATRSQSDPANLRAEFLRDAEAEVLAHAHKVLDPHILTRWEQRLR